MKTYHLRLVTDDFVKGDSVWTSGVLDLYDNYSDESEMATPSYRNYSTTKSNYGLDLIGNGTFVGLEVQSTGMSTPTELGFVEDGRFIDESANIDVVDYQVTYSGVNGTADILTALDFYSADLPDAQFPNEWAFTQGVFSLNYIGATSVDRYARVVLRIRSDQDVSAADIELTIKIQIGEPLQGGIAYKSIRDSLKAFPEWMDVRELDNENPADPSMATPYTVGGKMLNAVAGEWLDEIRGDLAYTHAQKFINTADVTQKAWVYSSSNISSIIYSVTGDSIELARCASLRDFYELTDDEDGFWYDDVEKIIFVTKDYDDFQVNYESKSLRPNQIWNWFDEFGLAVDLQRHKLESNESFKARILDVFINKPGVGIDAFKLALRRELNLWQYFNGDPNATPDSAYQGATPEVLEISDLELHSDFVDIHGVPTKKFRDLVEELARTYPSTWGYFKWNEATWDAGGQQGDGYDVLANVWDATPLSDPDTQSGVGDGNDLYVFRPDEVTGAREFTGRLKVRGRYKSTRTEARKIAFDVNIWGEAPYDKYTNPVITIPFTIRIELPTAAPDGAGGVVYHTFSMRSQNNRTMETLVETVNSYGEYRFMSDAGDSIPGQTWRGGDGELYTTNDDFSFTWDDIDSVELHPGTWDGGSYTNVPVTDNFTAWFIPAETIEAGDPVLTATGRYTVVVLKSKDVYSETDTWVTEKQRFTVELNGALPDQSLKNYTIDLPKIIWPSFISSGQVYKVEIATRDGSSGAARGGFTTDANGDPLFIPDTYIEVNSTGGWVDGVLEFADSTTSFEFSSLSSTAPAYPVPNCPFWEMFEATGIDEFEGVVDENGPWRNGVAPLPGNTNYNLLTLEPSRDDFSIPNSEDYVVTWMGVEADNGRVLVWLDSNVVQPAFDDGTTTTYPSTAIVETLEGSDYIYGPFVVRARINSALDPRWEPQVHSGWFYDRNDEYYLYSIPADETATPTSVDKVLGTVARMGAPIIVKTDEATPVEYRQVAFWDEDAEGHSTTTATQTVYGTGTTSLFVAYEDIYDVTVTNLTTDEVVSASTYSSTNEITTGVTTNRDHDYEVTFRVRNSFFADHDYVYDADNTQRTVLNFDAPLASPVTITYEASKFDPATPVDLALNTFYTIMDEGYIFISHNEYDLFKVEVKLSPSSLIADGEDYLMISLRSLDQYGNPKPNATFTLGSTFGTLSDTVVTTDDDGFAAVKLTADTSTADLTGVITISGDIDATVTFQVTATEDQGYRVTAVPNVQQIPADGISTVYIYGKVENQSYEPVPNAVVYWRKGRYMYDVWNQQYSTTVATPGTPDRAGVVVADDDGVFMVGPFLSATPNDPGYWMLAVESELASPHYSDGGIGAATPNWPPTATPTSWENAGATPDWDLTGDVVFWVEYPHYQHGVENLNGLPKTLTQLGQRPDEIPEYNAKGAYVWPALYDESDPYAPATPLDPTYLPSKWYAIDRYNQYQLGLLGNNRVPETTSDLTQSHPDYRKY